MTLTRRAIGAALTALFTRPARDRSTNNQPTGSTPNPIAAASRRHRPQTVIRPQEKPDDEPSGRQRNRRSRRLTTSDLALFGGRWRPDHTGTRADARSGIHGFGPEAEFLWTAKRLIG
jgi:hypothetical protein